MIRPLSEKDYNIAIDIVNTNWKRTYSNYVNPLLLRFIALVHFYSFSLCPEIFSRFLLL